MKIRTGFVSNSSSSSFLIYGVQLGGFHDDEKEELLEFFGTKDLHKISNQLEETKLTCTYLIDWECELLYIGRGPENMPDDQTHGEWKKEIEKEINDFIGREKEDKIECQYLEGSTYC